jgi:hypothetical protein
MIPSKVTMTSHSYLCVVNSKFFRRNEDLIKGMIGTTAITSPILPPRLHPLRIPNANLLHPNSLLPSFPHKKIPSIFSCLNPASTPLPKPHMRPHFKTTTHPQPLKRAYPLRLPTPLVALLTGVLRQRSIKSAQLGKVRNGRSLSS